jgi:hypothetical protein
LFEAIWSCVRIVVSLDPRNHVKETYRSEVRVAIRDATPARIIVTLVSLLPVPPPEVPSGMTGDVFWSLHTLKAQP